MQIPFFKLKMILCIVLIPYLSLAQTSLIDSLENQISLHLQHDTVRIDLLTKYALETRFTGSDKTILYLEEALVIAEELGDVNRKAKAYKTRAVVYSCRSAYDMAESDFNTAIELYQVSNHLPELIKSYSGMSTVYQKKGDLDKALEWLNKALDLNKELKDDKAILSPLIEIGNVYSAKSDYEQAMIYYERALLISENIGDLSMQAVIYGNIGSNEMARRNNTMAMHYFNKVITIEESLPNPDLESITTSLYHLGRLHYFEKNYDKSLIFFERTLKQFRSQKNKDGEATVLITIGNIYGERNDYITAKSYYENSIEISRETNNEYILANSLGSIGLLNIKLGEYDEALVNLNKSFEISEKNGFKRVKCNLYVGFARVYFVQKKYAEAINNATKAESIALDLKLVGEQQEIYELLSEVHVAQGNYKKAYHSHVKYKVLSDSLFNKENIEKITALEYEYAYKARLDSAERIELALNNEVAQANINYERSQRQILYGVIIFLILMTLLISIISILRVRHAKSESEKILVEQKLLRSQMTPHFIFNSISVLQGIIASKEYPKSEIYLSKFSRLLRQVLENSSNKAVKLSDELIVIEKYLSIQNLGIENLYDYRITVDEGINKEEIMVPPMIVQPFVENAIEHGFQNKGQDRKIEIDIKFEGDELICTIKDNGVGINFYASQPLKHNKTSMSSVITSKRLKMLSKEFKVKTDVKIQDRNIFNEQGTLVTLMLPYKIA